MYRKLFLVMVMAQMACQAPSVELLQVTPFEFTAGEGIDRQKVLEFEFTNSSVDTVELSELHYLLAYGGDLWEKSWYLSLDFGDEVFFVESQSHHNSAPNYGQYVLNQIAPRLIKRKSIIFIFPELELPPDQMLKIGLWASLQGFHSETLALVVFDTVEFEEVSNVVVEDYPSCVIKR